MGYRSGEPLHLRDSQGHRGYSERPASRSIMWWDSSRLPTIFGGLTRLILSDCRRSDWRRAYLTSKRGFSASSLSFGALARIQAGAASTMELPAEAFW